MSNRAFTVTMVFSALMFMAAVIIANLPPKAVEVSGRIIAVQDSFWNGSYTTIQPTNGYAVQVRGVWGATNDEVRVRAREAQ